MTPSAGAATELDMVLVYDPNSLATTDAAPVHLHVTDAEPVPERGVDLHRQLEDPRSERQNSIHFLRDGQIVGMAWKCSSLP